MTNWVRARRPEQISKREGSLLIAARRLFKKEGYENVSLNRIADEAGFTKSNIYRYFSSREEIFLSLYTDLVTAWSEDIVKEYKNLPDNVSVEKFAKRWVEVTLKHEGLLDLHPVVVTSLERNSSVEELTAFKRTVKELFDEHFKGLNRLFPFMTWEDVRRFLVVISGIMASLWPASNPDTALARVYRKKEFQGMKPDFARDMTWGIVTVISGLKPNPMDER